MSTFVEFPQSRCLAGIATADVTPPVGIYHRMWGAATHDRSTGIHRPLMETVVLLAPLDSRDLKREGHVFVGLDHCLLGKREMDDLLGRVGRQAGIDRDRITVYFSHTHGAGLMGYNRVELPGGDLIPAYLEQVAERIAQSIDVAAKKCRPAHGVYTHGHCTLAQNRDYLDRERNEYMCGFNPDGPVDPRVLVARFTDAETDENLFCLVNYACHPTTLAWDNTLISPDYIGALREEVEAATGAPLLFVQGASGDIGPRDGFVGDVAVADRNGRQLAHAVLEALESLPPSGKRFEYTGPVISGATIGTWDYQELSPDRMQNAATWKEVTVSVDLNLRPDLPQKEELLEEQGKWTAIENAALQAGNELEARDARAMIERATRRLARVEHLPRNGKYTFEMRFWKMGDAVWIALDGEHYNLLQRQLRERFPDVPLMIGTLANGSNVWYLPDKDSYGKGLYQEAASVLVRGSLELVIEKLVETIGRM